MDFEPNFEGHEHDFVRIKLTNGETILMCNICGYIKKINTYAQVEADVIKSIEDEMTYMKNAKQDNLKQEQLENDILFSIEDEMSYMANLRQENLGQEQLENDILSSIEDEMTYKGRSR